MLSDKEYKQANKYYLSREKHMWFLSKGILIAIALVCGVLVWGKMIFNFDWLSSIAFMVLLYVVFELVKREGYKEGFLDGCEDGKSLLDISEGL